VLSAVLAGLTGCGPAPDNATVNPSPSLQAPTIPALPSPAPSPSPVASADQPAAPPARIRLPSIGVDAPIIDSGVDEHGEMRVPDDIHETGWYRFSPPPGSTAGSSVVAGHVDDRIQGRGAFYDLAGVTPGDPVVVTTTAGNELDYRVSDVRNIAKATLPVDEIFALDGPPRLTLVTCGGSFDRATRNYQDNIVVTAIPIS
jgi:LPXTG-site transpeptidase (sortase) family protein